MSSSDSAANEALDAVVTAGGSWWVGLALSATADDLSGTVDEAPMSRVELPRTSAAWAAASGRSVHPAADVVWPEVAPSAFTPVEWVLWDAATDGDAVYAGRLADADVTAGSTVSIAASALTLSAPADPFSI